MSSHEPGVYVMRQVGASQAVPTPHKIGISTNLPLRLISVTQNSGTDLEIVETRERPSDARLVERVAHYLLSEKRIKGEWFNVTTAEAIDAVQLAIQQIDDGVVTYDSFKGKSTRNTVLIDRVARDAAIGIRTTPTIKRMADEAAESERRTTSQWIENLIIEALEKKKR